MAANREPIFTLGRISKSLRLPTVDPEWSIPASNTLATDIYECDSPSGARIEQIRITARGQNDDPTLVRFYHRTGSNPATDLLLLFEEQIPAFPVEDGINQAPFVVKLSERSDLPILELENGQALAVGLGAQGVGTMTGFDVHVFGGTYE